jgi:flagellar biogenesis protein FliO
VNLKSHTYPFKSPRVILAVALLLFLLAAVLRAAAEDQPAAVAPGVASQLPPVVVTNAAVPSLVVPAVNTLAIPGTLPDTGASILRVLGALALVISLFLGGVWLFRNWQRLAVRKGRAPRLNVLEVKSLGQRQAIYVVGYEQQRILLASSPAGITLLTHLPEEDETKTVAATTTAPAAPAAPAVRMSFAEAFQHVLNRRQ